MFTLIAPISFLKGLFIILKNTEDCKKNTKRGLRMADKGLSEAEIDMIATAKAIKQELEASHD